jgi:predicted GNAT family N-acyltransferase
VSNAFQPDLNETIADDFPVDQIHDTIIPSPVQISDQISASIRFHGLDTRDPVSARVVRISPIGVELSIPKALVPHEASDKPGALLNLTVKIAGQKSEFFGLCVKLSREESQTYTLGVRWCEKPAPRGDGAGAHAKLERRQTMRWLCSPDFMPTGVAPNPARFNDFLHFKVLDLSPTGMLWLTSPRNRYLIPGMTLESTISFPMCAQIRVAAKIVNTRVIQHQDKPVLALGMSLVRVDRQLKDTLAQYIFQFGPKSSIERLRSSGLTVPSAAQAVEFGFVRDEEDYRQVLALRLASYQADGRLPADATTDEVADVYDSRSQLVIARHRGEVVASMRIMYHEPKDAFDFEQYAEVPSGFPDKHNCVEVGRICVHPAFRRSDLFYNLLRHLAVITVQARRRYICASAFVELLPIYRRVGAVPTGIRFPYTGFIDSQCELVVWDIVKTITGAALNPFVWNYLCSDLVSYLDQTESLEFSPMMNLRMALYRLFRPMTPTVIRMLSSKEKYPRRPALPSGTR